MITDTFDNLSPAIINPIIKDDAPEVNACIITFSYEIEKQVAEKYASGEIASLWCASGRTPVYLIERNGKRFAFYKTYVGAPITTGLIEDATMELKCNKFILFGGAGCLNREIAHGKVMVPTEAYRDEGTSYHYAPAADYISIPNAHAVESFMKEMGFHMFWEKRGRPIHSIVRREIILKSGKRKAAYRWRWNVRVCRRCVPSEA